MKGSLEAFAVVSELEGVVAWQKIKWNGFSIKGKAGSEAVISSDSRLFIKIPDKKIHVFDYKTGIRL